MDQVVKSLRVAQIQLGEAALVVRPKLEAQMSVADSHGGVMIKSFGDFYLSAYDRHGTGVVRRVHFTNEVARIKLPQRMLTEPLGEG